MKKKGFTLIELLAVIVILAIIALIATPAVLNIIEDSRKGAAEASARNIVSTAKTYYMSETMNGRTVGTIDLSTNTLKYDGDQASKGNITFINGKPEAKMYISGYCVEVAVDGKVTSEKKAEDECEVTISTTSTVYADGTPLLYDPARNVKCIDTEVETNVNNYKSTHTGSYSGKPTITGLTDGCMKWYAFLTDENSETVNLILDHNTTALSAWNENGGETPDTVNAELQDDITNWNAAVKSTARLISASEVNQLMPTASDFTWDINDSDTWYGFHDGARDLYIGEPGKNKGAWLFDNTYNCTPYGCNVADDETCGYWTSSFVSLDEAWHVPWSGGLFGTDVSNGDEIGVRPVITVPKSIFE